MPVELGQRNRFRRLRRHGLDEPVERRFGEPAVRDDWQRKRRDRAAAAADGFEHLVDGACAGRIGSQVAATPRRADRGDAAAATFAPPAAPPRRRGSDGSQRNAPAPRPSRTACAPRRSRIETSPCSRRRRGSARRTCAAAPRPGRRRRRRGPTASSPRRPPRSARAPRALLGSRRCPAACRSPNSRERPISSCAKAGLRARPPRRRHACRSRRPRTRGLG